MIPRRAGWFCPQSPGRFSTTKSSRFIPGAPRGFTVAYVPVAHGIVPWWSEGYETQEKGTVPIPRDNWFKARADVQKGRFSIYVNDQFVFEKRLTYYLESGRPGFFVGTATDAKISAGPGAKPRRLAVRRTLDATFLTHKITETRDEVLGRRVPLRFDRSSRRGENRLWGPGACN